MKIKHIYESELTLSEIQHELKSLIPKKRKDSIGIHFLNTFFLNGNENESGSIEGNVFKYWYYHSWYTGPFYPVIKGVIFTQNDNTHIRLRWRINSFGLLFNTLVILFILIGSIFDPQAFFGLGIIVVLMFLAFGWIVPLFLAKASRKAIVEKLKLKSCATIM